MGEQKQEVAGRARTFGVAVALGIAIGAGAGVALGNLAVGAGLGLVLGAGIGAVISGRGAGTRGSHRQVLSEAELGMVGSALRQAPSSIEASLPA